MSQGIRKVGINGLGSKIPSHLVTNEEISRNLDTSDEWITQRTGIRQRYFASEDERPADMAIAASRQAIARSGLAPADIDCIVVTSTICDYHVPITACLVQDGLGIPEGRAGGYDLNAACSGFTFGLMTAYHYVAMGTYENVLVIGTERVSSILNPDDRSSYILFGDGAGAAVVQPLERAGRGEILSFSMKLKGDYDVTYVEAGGAARPMNEERLAQKKHQLVLHGRDIFKFAVRSFAELVGSALEPYGRKELGMVLPHQVNRRIVEAAMEKLEISMDKVFLNIDKYGNCGSASVPIALEEADRLGLFPRGKLVPIVAFGGGLTFGHVLCRW
jgi:3-oxoacyl-[acyl-carrier-protein] synthase III